MGTDLAGVGGVLADELRGELLEKLPKVGYPEMTASLALLLGGVLDPGLDLELLAQKGVNEIQLYLVATALMSQRLQSGPATPIIGPHQLPGPVSLETVAGPLQGDGLLISLAQDHVLFILDLGDLAEDLGRGVLVAREGAFSGTNQHDVPLCIPLPDLAVRVLEDVEVVTGAGPAGPSVADVIVGGSSATRATDDTTQSP